MPAPKDDDIDSDSCSSLGESNDSCDFTSNKYGGAEDRLFRDVDDFE